MKPEHIIVHHSATADSDTFSWNAIRRYHVQTLGWRDIGYHYGVELVGREVNIMVGRMSNEYGAHCRGGDMNRKSLGVCFVGNYDAGLVSAAMMASGLRLVRALIDIFNIDPANVHGHNEFSSKTCPGKLFDMDAFRVKLQ